MKYFLIFLSSLILVLSQLAIAGPEKMDGIEEINIKRLKVVDSKGQLFFMSENGRFVIQGQMTDTWSKTTLDTLDEVRFAASHVEIGLLSQTVSGFTTIKLGEGEKEVIIFVDPMCPYCKKLLKDASQHLEKYTFKVVVVPALGEESAELSKKLFCSTSGSDLLKALLNNTINRLDQKSNCDLRPYDMSLVTAQLLEIKAVPYIISPDGSYRSGADKNIWNWLKTKS